MLQQMPAILSDPLLATAQSDAPIAGAEGGPAPSSPTTAQPGSPSGSGPPPGGGPAGPFGGAFIWVLLLMFVVMMVLTGMSGRKERRRQAEMLASLKKHERVRTRGGILGTIVELKDDEILLEVDKASNTRIRLARSAVEQVLADGRAGGGKASANAPPTAPTTPS